MSNASERATLKNVVELNQKNYGTFEELEVYQAAREFRKKMYRVAKGLPDFEKFGLTSQMRRAALSLTNNIAEGHGRFHYMDNIRFVLISRGSLNELIDDLNTCEDENYLSQEKVAAAKEEGHSLRRQMNGYIRYLRDSKAGESLALHESCAAYGTDDDLSFLDELLTDD